ncbi:MAG: HlyD family secretion protein [Alteromonadaceae bacterium]|jgi:HlyD family secretion protein
MDIVKKKLKKKLVSRKNLVLIVSTLLLLTLMVISKNSLDKVSLAKKDLLFATVKKGDIDVTVEGYGKLTSDKLKLITTLTRATVQDIILKPGAAVAKESIIVKLANPELLQKVENSQQELSQIKANLRQLKLNQQRELLDEDSRLAELESRYETAKLRRVAEEKLVKEGIVSELTYKESVLNEEQLNKRIKILHKRVQQLYLVHQEGINIQQERIKQQQGKLNIAQNRLDKLDIKAGFDGVLQKLSVKLGQSLAPGAEVALIGSITELIALVRVPQSQAQLVVVGQQVEIDTRQDKIIGRVIRIDPIVADNTVEVEISLPKSLPKSARPQQNVDAVITTATLNNVYYIERPANTKALSSIDLYKLNKDETLAHKTRLQFGEKTGQFIEIRSGVQAGNRFIISDLSNYSTKEISIN